MQNWKNNLQLDEGELITHYHSNLFDSKIMIRLMDTPDEAHPKQSQLISDLINKEQQWMNKALDAIIPYYKELYLDYRSGWERGGADEPTIEANLPQNIDREKLLALITPSEIFINQEKECSSGKFGILFDCTWDSEHGLGLYFANWKVVGTGGEDAAFGFY